MGCPLGESMNREQPEQKQPIKVKCSILGRDSLVDEAEVQGAKLQAITDEVSANRQLQEILVAKEAEWKKRLEAEGYVQIEKEDKELLTHLLKNDCGDCVGLISCECCRNQDLLKKFQPLADKEGK